MSVARRERSSRGSFSSNEYQILAEFRYQKEQQLLRLSTRAAQPTMRE